MYISYKNLQFSLLGNRVVISVVTTNQNKTKTMKQKASVCQNNLMAENSMNKMNLFWKACFSLSSAGNAWVRHRKH
jgi:hypothetical protein